MADVVLIHGHLHRAWAMTLIARRLRAKGHQVRSFSYASTTDTLAGHAKALHAFIGESASLKQHLVGHSMGGLVALQMLSQFDDLPAGNLLMLGTPVNGSGLARRIEKMPVLKRTLGRAKQDLIQGVKVSLSSRQIGMICGTRSAGIGRLFGKQPAAGDGSVLVSETLSDGLTDHIQIPVSHAQMLYSRQLIGLIEQFMAHGCFRQS